MGMMNNERAPSLSAKQARLRVKQYASEICAGALDPGKGAQLIAAIALARGSRAFDDFVYLESELEEASDEERRIWCFTEIEAAARRFLGKE